MYDPMNVYKGRYQEFIESIVKERPLNENFEYAHNHHIIPKCTFSERSHPYIESAENKILLTYKEHFIAHRILAEDNPTHEGLVRAFWRMANGDMKCTPEEYEESRRLFADSQRGNNYGHATLGKPKSPEARKNMSVAAKIRSKKYPNNLPHDGRMNRDRVKIYCISTNQERYVLVEEADKLIATGDWLVGASPLNRVHTRDRNWRMSQSISHKGKSPSNKGRRSITNGTITKYVEESLIDSYLDEGWYLGRHYDVNRK